MYGPAQHLLIHMPESLRHLLLTILRAQLPDAAWTWLTGAIERAARNPDALLQAYTAASSRIGGAGLAPSEAERLQARALAPDLAIDRWTLEDAARAALLLSQPERTTGGADAFIASAIACYEQGDAREQQSWLRAVAVLPEPERFLPYVVDACRTNILPLFESTACENPYPSRHFPERNFNQMVLKALFNGVALARVVGLAGRLNPELTRMAADYAAERRAAGRPVPADISLAMAEPTFTQERQ
jgi:hypothetical protein